MESMELLQKGESLCFTFKYEAEQFAIQHDLKVEYNDGELIDDEHFEVKGYKGGLYWLAR